MSGKMDPERRKRINLYKKIIVAIIVSLILLPTILCIILFIRIGFLERNIQELKTSLSEITSEVDAAGHSADRIVQNQTSEAEATASALPVKDTTAAETSERDTNYFETTITDETTIADETIVADETTYTDETTIVEETEKSTEQDLIDQALSEGRKVVYLTFDDGPSANTERLLDVLDQYGVRVTFFVNYRAGFEQAYKDIVLRGHTLATHTYSHDYGHVYGNYNQFVEEVSSLRDYVVDLTGVDTKLFRFPGGSSNSMTKLPIATFIDYLEKERMTYFDWNVSSGDGAEVTREQVYDNVIKGIKSHDISVVLMHDAEYKMSTFEAVPDILETLKEMNALILPITSATTPIHHQVN